ncbi:MAG: benzoate/H(+) symporter BenE family transporter [Castellaniella sp.]
MLGILRHLRISHITAGFIAVLVGYSSSVAIIFQAASAVGASAAELNSWMWALGIGMGVTCIALSFAWRQPVLTAWSTPGGALLVTSLAGLSMGEAVGAFLFSAVLITLSGLTGWFRRIMDWVPPSLAAAMLAGILAVFGMRIFTSLETDWALTGLMFLGFFVLRQLAPRYAVPATLALGMLWCALHGMLAFEMLDWTPARPVFMAPEFSLTAMIGVGLPLFIVTMTSQNIPGLAVLRANGYPVPASPLISWTGVTSLILAPFGGFAFNLAAITAAICMSDDAGHDRHWRWLASVWAGIFYLLTGIFGATVVSLFLAFPAELVATIAGLALLGTIAQGLSAALEHPAERDAALVTFLTTASGMSLLGIGSAFWGLLLGMLVWQLGHARRHRQPA